MTIALRSRNLDFANIVTSAPSTASAHADRLTVRALPSVTAVARSDWDRLFPGQAEGWDYFRACEQSAPEGFTSSAIGAFAGETLVAAAPLFRLNYRLDMPLQGPLRPVGDWLNRHAPRLVNMPVLGMGSPLTEECPIGLLPGMSAPERASAFEALLQGVSEHARASGISVLALKDVTDRDDQWAREPLTRAGFARVATLPVATLHLPFKTEDEYLASLSAQLRKDLRKKMRGLANAQVEIRDSIDGVEDEIIALFHETKAKRKADYAEFDEVPDAYFREVVGNLGGRAKIMLIRIGGQLASFSIFIEEKDRMIGKYVGMRYPLAREHNVYFLNWMLLVRRCIETRMQWMQVGQTTYRQKARLGCKLKRSWVYFKHQGAVMGPLFRTFGPMMAFDQMDPDLRELGADAPYLPADGTL
jgi:predicted N-acyltransferase